MIWTIAHCKKNWRNEEYCIAFSCGFMNPSYYIWSPSTYDKHSVNVLQIGDVFMNMIFFMFPILPHLIVELIAVFINLKINSIQRWKKKTKSMLILMKMLCVDVFVPIWIYSVDVHSILGSFAKAWWRKRFIGTFAIADSTNQRLSTFAQGQLMFISFNKLFVFFFHLGMYSWHHEIFWNHNILFIDIILFELDLFFSSHNLGQQFLRVWKHLCGGCSCFAHSSADEQIKIKEILAYMRFAQNCCPSA